ncbi:MAG: hypothetical protein R3C44_20610 [Chloroflexota bacterium]
MAEFLDEGDRNALRPGPRVVHVDGLQMAHKLSPPGATDLLRAMILSQRPTGE